MSKFVARYDRSGRPYADIDRRMFERLCAMQCTREEIAYIFGVNKCTITAWCKRTYGMDFATIFKIKRQKGRVDLRKKQWEIAEHNADMAIWLGKQYLGQSDSDKVAAGNMFPEQLKRAIESLADSDQA